MMFSCQYKGNIKEITIRTGFSQGRSWPLPLEEEYSEEGWDSIMNNLPKIKDLTLADYFRLLASDSIFPSAGSSAAITGAHAAALFAMACRVNLRKAKSIQDQDSTGLNREVGPEFWNSALQEAEELTRRYQALAQEDGQSYLEVLKNDLGGPEHAIEVPLEIARCSRLLLAAIATTLPKSYPPVRADLETARCLAQSCREAAVIIARHNLALIKDRKRCQHYVNLIDRA